MHAFICFFKNKRQDGVFADEKQKKKCSAANNGFVDNNNTSETSGEEGLFYFVLACITPPNNTLFYIEPFRFRDHQTSWFQQQWPFAAQKEIQSAKRVGSATTKEFRHG